jgi:hypothetical protein
MQEESVGLISDHIIARGSVVLKDLEHGGGGCEMGTNLSKTDKLRNCQTCLMGTETIIYHFPDQ